MPTKKEYQEKCDTIQTAQDWINLLNDDSNNFFELTSSLSKYCPGDPAFWKIAEINGDWKFNVDDLTTLIYNATDVVVSNMFGSERPVIEQNKRQYGYNRYQLDNISKKIVDVLDLEHVDANINVQPPGSVKNLHTDILSCVYHREGIDLSKLDFDLSTRQPAGYPTFYRILVALTDWQPGWMFQLGVDQWAGWKKGDVIAIDWQNVAHCTANASFVDRPLLKITASAKNNWIQQCIDSGQIRKFTL